MARKAGELGLFGAWLNPYYPDRQRIEFGAADPRGLATL